MSEHPPIEAIEGLVLRAQIALKAFDDRVGEILLMSAEQLANESNAIPHWDRSMVTDCNRQLEKLEAIKSPTVDEKLLKQELNKVIHYGDHVQERSGMIETHRRQMGVMPKFESAELDEDEQVITLSSGRRVKRKMRVKSKSGTQTPSSTPTPLLQPATPLAPTGSSGASDTLAQGQWPQMSRNLPESARDVSTPSASVKSSIAANEQCDSTSSLAGSFPYLQHDTAVMQDPPVAHISTERHAPDPYGMSAGPMPQAKALGTERPSQLPKAPAVSSKFTEMMAEIPPSQAAATAPPPQTNEINNPGPPGTSGVSLYTLLGVERTATQAQIRKAIVKHMARLHPDRDENRGDPEANEKFTDFIAMVGILEDPKLRKKYDDSGHAEGIESLTTKIKRLTM